VQIIPVFAGWVRLGGADLKVGLYTDLKNSL
jgi:hypothetical protein